MACVSEIKWHSEYTTTNMEAGKRSNRSHHSKGVHCTGCIDTREAFVWSLDWPLLVKRKTVDPAIQIPDSNRPL